jgi:hypothetical protein
LVATFLIVSRSKPFGRIKKPPDLPKVQGVKLSGKDVRDAINEGRLLPGVGIRIVPDAI